MRNLAAILMAAGLAACGNDQPANETSKDAAPAPSAAERAAASITPEAVMRHVEVLASDEYEGRMPGTPGGQKTVAYLVEQFKALGLEPGNPDGSYTQDVPLAGITGEASGYFQLRGKRLPLEFGHNAVAVTSHFESSVEVADSELVFVGYGIQAPEYGWDDYKGLDVRGKTIVMLVNDPPIKREDGSLDDSMFGGRAMTYYGRWTYKYEIASQLGAAAAVIVHQTKPAGYPWEVVGKGWTGEQFVTLNEHNNTDRVPIEAWISVETARTLFEAAGHDFAATAERAASADFKPLPLKAQANFTLANELRTADSQNVIARLPGSDPDRRDEHVVFTAHWDHLGNDGRTDGDGIYNGALDNATGTGGLLELARAYTKLPEAPPRSLLFLAVTAEEQGLIGSRHYAQNPLWPLHKTLANINMDGLNPYGRTSDVQVVGSGQSSLEEILERAAKAQGRHLVPEPEPEKGYYYRSDHFEFAKVGVPALYAESGDQYVGKPADYGQKLRAEYVANDYHKPSDEIKDDWDLSGGVEDLQLYFHVGLDVARADQWPEWKPGSEFRGVRRASLEAAGSSD